MRWCKTFGARYHEPCVTREIYLEKVAAKAHHDDLALGVPEAHVVLESLDLAILDHDSCKQNALEGAALLGHALDGRNHDLLHDLLLDLRREHCGKMDR